MEPFQDASGNTWYYSEDLGLWFDCPNLVGVGYTLDEIEKFSEGYI
jgi:hypothetical protein